MDVPFYYRFYGIYLCRWAISENKLNGPYLSDIISLLDSSPDPCLQSHLSVRALCVNRHLSCAIIN